jgi:hypothetical protein
VRPFLGIEPPFLALLHALDRPGGSPDRARRVGTAAADPARSSDSVTLTRPPPPPPPLPHLQSETTLCRTDISADDSPSPSSSAELEIELSREASGTRRHYLRKCHQKKYENPKAKTETSRCKPSKVTMSVVEDQRKKETCVFSLLLFYFFSLILEIWKLK